MATGCTRVGVASTARRALLAAAFVSAAGAPAAAQTRRTTLDTVTIVASRTRTGDAGRSIEVITRDEIDRSSARTIADVLALRLGVDVYGRSPAQADISLRGSSAEQVVILVDGVRMSDAQSAHYALDLAVPLDAVERVEILRGAGSALYGPDAVGGVIDIVTRRNARGDARVRGGSFGTIGGAATDAESLGAAEVTTSAEYEKSDGHRDGTDYRIGQGRVAVTMPAGAGTLRTNLGAGVRDFGAAEFYAPFNSIERTGTATLDTRWETPVGQWSLAAGAGTRRHTDRYTLIRDEPAVYQNVHETWQTSGEVVARTISGPVAVALGADGAHDQLSSARLGGRREWRAGVFAEGTLGSPSSRTIDLGLRGDQSSGYGGFFSPSVSASTLVGDHVRLRTSGALGFRAPNWTERYYVDPKNQGDPDLKPERFWTAETGARLIVGGGSLDVAGYARHAENLIDWVKPANAPTSAVWQTMNVGTATYHGIEATLALPPATGVAYSIFGSGLTMDDSQGAALVGKYALRPITRQLGVRAALAQRGPFEASVEVVHARRASEDGHLTGNVRLGWRRRALRVTLDLTNLTNARWLDASAEPVAGRGAFVGIGWSGR